MTSKQTIGGVSCYRLTARDDTSLTTATVVPEWGANVIGFSFQEHDWAWPVPVLEAVDVSSVSLKPSSYGMPILAPTPGRVGPNQSGVFTYRGKQYQITPTRHGFLRTMAWQPAEYTGASIACIVTIHPGLFKSNAAFPFELHARHDLAVMPRSLRSQVSVTNAGTTAVPIAVGWHPYLHRSGACTVSLPAAARWELDGQPEPTPTGRILPVDDQNDFRSGRAVGVEEHWDDVFTELAVRDGIASCWAQETTNILRRDQSWVTMIAQRQIDIPVQTSDKNHWQIANVQLYTPRGRSAICIEPLSSPPDAINLLARGHERHNICELAPDQTISFEITMRIAIRSAKGVNTP
jgi:galactose mutarotase-like enzyme